MNPSIEPSFNLIDMTFDLASFVKSCFRRLKFADMKDYVILDIKSFDIELSVTLRQISLVAGLTAALWMHNCLF